MAYQLVQSKQEYIGLSADTKPEAASPGYHVCPYASAVNDATFQFSILWEEVDA